MSDESDPILSVRIVLDRPNEKTAAVAAVRLRDVGLKVEHVSPRGLLVSGAKSRLEEFFNTRIDFSEKIPQLYSEPHFGRLPETASYGAYFPSEPVYF